MTAISVSTIYQIIGIVSIVISLFYYAYVWISKIIADHKAKKEEAEKADAAAALADMQARLDAAAKQIAALLAQNKGDESDDNKSV